MNRREIIGELAFGQKLNMIHYLAPSETNDWVIFEHGQGEKGIVDGSQLAKLEVNGWPMLIVKQGLELPFNLCAVQSSVDNFNVPNRVLAPHLVLNYNAAPPLQTGLSMGGIGTYNMLWEDACKLLCAIVPICGAPNSGYLTGTKAPRAIPVLAVHGDKDTIVAYSRGKAAAEKINALDPGQVEFITLPGVGHNAWVPAYDTHTELGKHVLDFVLLALGANETQYDKGYRLGSLSVKERALKAVLSL